MGNVYGLTTTTASKLLGTDYTNPNLLIQEGVEISKNVKSNINSSQNSTTLNKVFNDLETKEYTNNTVNMYNDKNQYNDEEYKEKINNTFTSNIEKDIAYVLNLPEVYDKKGYNDEEYKEKNG